MMQDFGRIRHKLHQWRMQVVAVLVSLALPSMMLGEESVSAEHKLLSVMTDELTIPAYIVLQDSARRLETETRNLCQLTDNQNQVANADNLKAVQTVWESVAYQWSKTQVFTGGPMPEPFRYWKIQFWPDKKNLVQQKFKPIFADTTQLSASDLAAKSIAVQGIGAVEYLLFDDRYGNQENRNQVWCSLLLGTVVNLTKEIELVTDKWKGERSQWLYFDVENDSETQFKGRVELLYRGLVVALDVTTVRKLAEPLRLIDGQSGPDQPNPYLFEYWRSGTSMQSIGAMLAGLKQAYELEGGFRSYLFFRQKMGSDLPAAKLLDKQIADSFFRANDILSQILNGYKNKAHGSVIETDAMLELYRSLISLNQLFKIEYSRLTGLKLGFNSTDGD